LQIAVESRESLHALEMVIKRYRLKLHAFGAVQ
jgi:hypothetical protein